MRKRHEKLFEIIAPELCVAHLPASPFNRPQQCRRRLPGIQHDPPFIADRTDRTKILQQGFQLRRINAGQSVNHNQISQFLERGKLARIDPA